MSEQSRNELVTRHLEALKTGDSTALDALLRATMKSLQSMMHRMLQSFPAVMRWECTDDIFQQVAIRLTHALQSNPPSNTLHFYRLAAKVTRQQLIDLARKYSGRQSHASNHQTNPLSDAFVDKISDVTHDPQALHSWAELHEAVDSLPEPEREVFDLIWYQSLNRNEVQQLLAIDGKTVRKRWLSARLKLNSVLDLSETQRPTVDRLHEKR